MTPGNRPNQPSPRWTNLTDCLLRTRSLLFLRTPPASAAPRSRTCHPGTQRAAAPARPAQTHPAAHPGTSGFRGLSCHLHPLAKSHLVDADIAGDLGNRAATVKDESYRLRLVLRRIWSGVSNPFLALPTNRAAKPGVHRSGYGPRVDYRPTRMTSSYLFGIASCGPGVVAVRQQRSTSWGHNMRMVTPFCEAPADRHTWHNRRGITFLAWNVVCGPDRD